MLLCSGKVYYDLPPPAQNAASPTPRSSGWSSSTRCPAEALTEALAAYPNAEDFAWVQEEPANQGAWSFVAFRLPALLGGRPQLTVRGRPGSASPATGSGRAHEEQQRAVVAARVRGLTGADMYATDRGIEELADRRGEQEVTLAWLADRLQAFVDLNPEFEVAVERLATWLARDDEDELD